MEEIRILIVDSDEASRAALASVLGAEGWHVQWAAEEHTALARLREATWTLVLASLAVSSPGGPLFEVLRNLAEASGGVQVLFLVPALSDEEARLRLEGMGLPYTLKPIQLDDFLDQVSHLLLKTGAIRQPLRRVKELAAEAAQPERKESSTGGGMFARRDASSDYTEEELKQFEEEEERRRRAGEEKEKSGY